MDGEEWPFTARRQLDGSAGWLRQPAFAPGMVDGGAGPAYIPTKLVVLSPSRAFAIGLNYIRCTADGGLHWATICPPDREP